MLFPLHGGMQTRRLSGRTELSEADRAEAFEQLVATNYWGRAVV